MLSQAKAWHPRIPPRCGGEGNNGIPPQCGGLKRRAIGGRGRDRQVKGVERVTVCIRLKRLGRRHLSHWRICATDRRTARDGRVIEELGSYDPCASNDRKVAIHRERVVHWLRLGAQPSETVEQLLAHSGLDRKGNEVAPRPWKKRKTPPPPATKKVAEVKAEAPAEAAAEEKPKAGEEKAAKKAAEAKAEAPAEPAAESKPEAPAETAEEKPKAGEEKAAEKAVQEQAAAPAETAPESKPEALAETAEEKPKADEEKAAEEKVPE